MIITHSWTSAHFPPALAGHWVHSCRLLQAGWLHSSPPSTVNEVIAGRPAAGRAAGRVTTCMLSCLSVQHTTAIHLQKKGEVD